MVCYTLYVFPIRGGVVKRKKYSLREKKHAKTKIALANAFIDRLKTT